MGGGEQCSELREQHWVDAEADMSASVVLLEGCKVTSRHTHLYVKGSQRVPFLLLYHLKRN